MTVLHPLKLNTSIQVSMLKETKQTKRNVEKSKIMENKEKHRHHGRFALDDEESMTLLDYYAGQALIGLLAKLHYRDLDSAYDQRDLVDIAWGIADQMLKMKNS